MVQYSKLWKTMVQTKYSFVQSSDTISEYSYVRLFAVSSILKEVVHVHLNTDLSIIKIIEQCSEEEYYIVANTLQEAKHYYRHNLESKLKNTALITEFVDATEVVNIAPDAESLYALVNKYNDSQHKVETINIWNLLKFTLLEYQLQSRELTIPFVLCSSEFD